MKGVAIFACALALGFVLNLLHGEPMAWEGFFLGALGGVFGVAVYYWPAIRRYFAKPS